MPCTSYIHSPVYSFVGKLLHEAFAERFFVLSTLGAMPLRAAIFVYLDRSRMLSAKLAEFLLARRVTAASTTLHVQRGMSKPGPE